MSAWQPDDCVSSQELPTRQTRAAYAFLALSGFTLLLHHGWVAGLGQAPHMEAVALPCFLLVVHVAGWAAPAVLDSIEGRAIVAGWHKLLWWAVVIAAGVSLTWAIGRFVYGVDWPW
jgi:hypothetical protein